MTQTSQMDHQEFKDAMFSPTLSDDLLNALVVNEQYHHFPDTTMTVCCLTLVNGYTVIGQSACLDPANFDAQKGRQYSRAMALDRIREVESYVHRSRLMLNELLAKVAATGAQDEEVEKAG